MSGFRRLLQLLAVTVLQGAGAAAQTSTTRVAAVLAIDSTTAPKLGDTVTLAARVSLANGVIDTSRTIFFVQQGAQGIRIYRSARFGTIRVAAGDSVIVTGVVDLYRGMHEITATQIAVIPGTVRLHHPFPLSNFSQRSLVAHASVLVALSGTVVSSSIGRGDHVLRIVSNAAQYDTASVAVTESDRSGLDLGLDQFMPGDQVAVTGLLVVRTSRDGAARYEVFPASPEAIRATTLTQKTRRLTLIAAASILMVALLLLIAYGARKRLSEERRRTARALQESAARYRQLVEEAPMGMLVHRKGRILFANAAFARTAGLDAVEALRGRRLVDLVHEDERAAAREYLKAVSISAGGGYETQRQFRRLDGKRVELRIVGSAVDFGGQHAMQAIVFDVTAQAALELQLVQAQKMEAVGQLAAGVAHDFNNLLTVIMSCSTLALLALPDDSDAIRDIESIREASQRAGVLTHQLLAFSRKQVLQPRPVHVSATVASVAAMLRRVIGEDIDIELDTRATWNVSVDPGQLEQVVMNLAVNARDALSNGGVIRLRTKDAEVDAERPGPPGLMHGQYATIEVEDDGTGIDPAILPHLFEPFFTTKEAGQGTGLGLATVYGIVKQSGGFIYPSSIVGAGTTFRIYLPRDTRAVTASAEGVPPDSPKGAETILLVEDDQAVSAVTRRILEHNGYRVLTASNGVDGLHQLTMAEQHRIRIDLVLSDVVMPGLGGAAFGEYVAMFWPELRILYTSGYTENRVMETTPRGGAGLLDKPFAPERLLSAVARALDTGTTPRTARIAAMV